VHAAIQTAETCRQRPVYIEPGCDGFLASFGLLSAEAVRLGEELLLGSGYADVLAFESTGRPMVTEGKLPNSSESRRTVVAQVLAYASALHGLTQQAVTTHLSNLGPEE
jgi:hypothetical protein